MERQNFFNPESKILEFRANPTREGIFDLQNNGFNKFKYFRLQYPKIDRLKKMGVKYVMESWSNSCKILHSGLLSLRHQFYYFGDHTEIINGTKKTSLFIVYLNPSSSNILIYWFNQFDKKSVKMKRDFCNEYIHRVIKKGS
jgi:hypothetical protein